MQFEFLQWLDSSPSTKAGALAIDGQPVPLTFVRHPRARRYLLRLLPDGTARVTVPWRGSLAEARAFAHRHRDWLAGQLRHREARPLGDNRWLSGRLIFLRGELVELCVLEDARGRLVCFAGEEVALSNSTSDLRPAVEQHLRELARGELPRIVATFAAAEGLTVHKVSVRNQRSRWGSCSRRGNISLNWRLVQMPVPVRDYVIWHELMHLREMNHSPRFWRAVAGVCPGFEDARRWLRRHGESVR